ncbi:CCR4-NOT transcription complex subunit 2 isoform X1 [Schistocerca cancellata]|uniref:CCR4-NOT transcription complex subunit 2 isoform X1 n=1 Tax=Schistocerca cancellata TaxID=274614 RepID=UPI0021195E89|nr:CCR4-NOT transcription complex subunit 2 isoform X1 [Schistocerca cancellata]
MEETNMTPRNKLRGSNSMGMGSFSIQGRTYGSQGSINNFHSVFNGGGDTGSPPVLDLSEFPSLTNRGQPEPVPQPSPMQGKQTYGRPLRAALNPTKSSHTDNSPALMRHSPEVNTGGATRLHKPKGARPVRSTINPSKNCHSEHIPGLTSQSQDIDMGRASASRLLKNQVTVVKAPPSETNEFTMSSEDFPALPGTQRTEGPSPGGSLSVEKNLSVSNSDIGQETTVGNRAPGAEKSQTKRGIQTSPDGKVTRIPGSMVKDQFGMVGLLTFIRAAETDPNLVSLALGQDLTALGLNLNSPDNLYPNFGGPWAETPCRPQDIDFHVPPEYLINPNIRDKLGPVKLNRYKDDLLFYMFYTNIGDVAQLAAATELYNREWRYHTEEKVWITQAPGMGAVEKTSTYERGTYFFFDAQNWRKVAKEFHLDYNKLEGRPQMPSTINQSQTVM